MQISHRQIEFLSQPWRILIEELGEPLLFAKILAENRHFMRLGQFLQFLQRLFHLRLKFLKRPDRQTEFRDLYPPYQAGEGGFGLAEFAQLQPRERRGVFEDGAERIDAFHFG